MDEHTLNDLLECSVCLERLDTSSKVLPCQHTFCRKCLEVILSSHSELRCPECRVLVDIKIDELPPNVLLMRILEGMKNAAASATAMSNLNKSPRHFSPPIQLQNNLNKDNIKPLNTEPHPPPSPLQQQQQKQTPVHVQHHQANLLQQKSRNQQQSVASNAPSRRIVPHVFALYDYQSKETTDLSFKKGDILLLKKKTDTNWFFGELNGKEGLIPTNFVQIIVPLPVAQCIALYDFKMGPNEEEGCLTFEKGVVIKVLRRVDHNWAEGRIGSNIGIFPIAFVEMNSLAKQIMETISTENSVKTAPRRLPNLPTLIDDISSSTTTTSSPNTTCSSNSSSNSISSSPASNPTSPQNHPAVKYRDCKEKRHSLNAITSAAVPNLSVAQNTNRHSVEILSVPDTPATGGIPTSRMGYEKSRVNVLKSSGQQNFPPYLPWAYLAMYPYKPRKSDELELKKGCVYLVMEKCLDGWFKGKNWQDKSGVFPGNYVTPLRIRDQQQLIHQRKYSQGNIPTQPQIIQTQAQTENVTTGAVPELPPRSSPANCIPISASVWTKPLGQTVESFFNRKSNGSENSTTLASSSAVSLMKRLTHNMKRSKSPVSQGNPNPAFEDSSVVINKKNNLSSNKHPIHVRSGSCPSQLLQTLPLEMTTSVGTKGEHQTFGFGSQRHKPQKDRPSVQNVRQQMDTVNIAPVVPPLHTTMTTNHRKSQSLDTNTITPITGHNSPIAKGTNNSRESRFRCIVSYPPNSDVELELSVGDIVYVHKKQRNGWYKGTHARTNKTGLFPASFVELDI